MTSVLLLNSTLDINHFYFNETMTSIITNDMGYDEMSLCDPSNIYFNCTIEEFLIFSRGPQMLPLLNALLVTIFFLGILVTGVLGNVLVCVVIIRNSAMHTATNYYLFSLAVSDLIFLIMGLPFEVSLYWHQYPDNLGITFCKARAFLSEASTYVSVLTIVAFSMERFLAICHPLHLYTMSGFKRALRIIAILWVVSFLSASPFGVYTVINYINYPPDNSTILDSAFCAMLERPNNFPLCELSFVIFFVVPMVLIVVLYGRMGLRIRSRTKHSAALGVQHGSMHGESKQTQSRKAIIRMLAAVVITFFVCWAPFHLQRLMYLYAQNWEYFTEVNSYIFTVTGWLYYVSCTINPILYNVMSHRYRVAFRTTLCGKKKSHYNNGFARDQSSFRETTITGGGGYESSHLIRVRSVVPSTKFTRHKDKQGLTGGNIKWKEETITIEETLKEESSSDEQKPIADVVVVIGNSANGRPKCFTTGGNNNVNNNEDNECVLEKDEIAI